MAIGERGRRARLYRNPREAKIKGVCAGLGDYFGIDPLFFRVAFVAAFFFIPPWNVILYLFLAWILVDMPEDLYETEEEKDFWTNVRREPKGTMRDLNTVFQSLNSRLAAMERHVTSAEFELNKKFRDL